MGNLRWRIKSKCTQMRFWREYAVEIQDAEILRLIRCKGYAGRGKSVVRWSEMPIMVNCGWNECQKRGPYIGLTGFKVCGRCKMAYYCSRTCQKKAWNSGHRDQCTILVKYYKDALK